MSGDATALGNTTCSCVVIPEMRHAPFDSVRTRASGLSAPPWPRSWLANNSVDGVNPVSREAAFPPRFTPLAAPVTVSVTNHVDSPCGGQNSAFNFG